MESKRTLTDQAKEILDSTPIEAIQLYRQAFSDYPEECNEWDALFTLKAYRASGTIDVPFVNELVDRFSEDEKVTGLYGWLIYDIFVKGKSHQELLSNKRHILKLANIFPQVDQRQPDSYPCPLTLSIFKLLDAHKQNTFPATEIDKLLNQLDPELLSKTPHTFQVEGKNKENASDLEKYYSLLTKAKVKLGEYASGKELCTQALTEIDRFHYNNELWFKMRLAICEEKLGNTSVSEGLFQELLQTKAGGDKWFLYRDIANLYYEEEEYDKAWKYAVDAAFFGNEPHFLINLYLLQARILHRLSRTEEGKVLAELIAAILREEGWQQKRDYVKLFEYYQVDPDAVQDVRTYHRKAAAFWRDERYKGRPIIEGKIVSIHRNQKRGIIKTVDGKAFDFHRRDFVKRQRDMLKLRHATVEFIAMEGYAGRPVAEQIKVLEIAKTAKKKDHPLVGNTYTGKVTNIVDFGIFFHIAEHGDGLLHKSKLPLGLHDNFQTNFSVGEHVEVRIADVTEKGLKLELAK